MIFQTEKSLKDLGDKLPADKKAQIEAALSKLKEAHKSQDIAAIDSSMKELETVFHAASQDMYSAQQQQGGAQQQAGPQPNQGAQQQSSNNGGDDNVTDVPFEEVK
jgi:molecular chaperone DnaK